MVVEQLPDNHPTKAMGLKYKEAHMKANNPDTQALSLRSSITDPGLTGGTGAISHDLTASWKCCPGLPTATTFSDKK